MKFPAMNTIKSIFAILLTAVLPVRAALTESIVHTVNLAVPDGVESGTGDSIFYTNRILGVVPGAAWARLNVSLQIAGGYNGDLYVLLEHGTNYAILVNRPGRTASSDAGYGDRGFSVTFDDTALNGDIHAYRTRVNPLGGALTGVWRPDGRDVDPTVCLDTDSRTALLSGMIDGSPDGEWSLTVLDVAAGDQATLVSWGLSFGYTSPPEIGVFDGAGTDAPELTSGQPVAVQYGTAPLGVPVSKEFTVANSGNDTLTISGVTVPSGFIAIGLPTFPVSLAASGSFTFTAVFRAESGGMFSGDIVIGSNDADEAAFSIPVSGAVDANDPVISLCATNRVLVMSGSPVNLPDLTSEVSATDVEPGALEIAQSPVAGTPLEAGETTVVITVTDTAGNQTVCQCVVTVVRLPSAGPDFGETTSDVPTAFRVSKLIANDSDPDGAPLSVTAVGPVSAQGGSVVLASGVVTYTPPAGFSGTDTFTYTLSAGGRETTGTVTVQVREPSGVPSNAIYLRPAAPPASGMEMRFSGLPGRQYSVQFTQALSDPWSELARVNGLSSSGFVDFVHTNAPSGSGFYRCLPAQ
jgi:subtilisin-like proprotein convertase family protein